MAEPSSTKSLTQISPQLFVKTDGSPLVVFTQADDINGRSLILKSLRVGGAKPAIDPKTADVILVNQLSASGQKFLNIWRDDPTKSILNHTWVQSCINAERMLGEASNWGGHLAQVLNLDDDEDCDDDDDEENSGQNNGRADESLPTPTPSPEATQHSLATSVDPPKTRRKSNPQPRPNATASFASASASQTLTSPLSRSPSMSSNTGHPGASNTLVATQYPFTTPVPDISKPTPYQRSYLQADSPLVKEFFGHPEAFNILSDVMVRCPSTNMQDLGNTLQGVGPSALSTPQMANGVFQQSPEPDHGLRMSQSVEPADVRRFQRPSMDHTPALADASGANSYPSRTKQGICAGSSSRSIANPIFVKREDVPMLFWIQVEHAKRNELASLVKTHGGLITSDISTADYAVLYTSVGIGTQKFKDFVQHYQSASSFGVTAVIGRFVEASCEAGELLSEFDFLCEDPTTTKKRARRSISEAEAQPQVDATQPPGKKVKTGKSAHLPSKKSTRPPSPVQSESSKQPRVLLRYTLEERESLLATANEVFTEDPEASESYLATVLHERMNYRTKGAWQAFVARNKDDITSARTKGSIRYRKRRRHLEDDLERISQFFADGEDEGLDPVHQREAIFMRLLERKGACKTIEDWTAFYRTHADEIQARVTAKCEIETEI
ncbi:hypothetical protein FA15DRAFT_662264 [Coprinopsis marcescibilis]|uniref:Uncharacterized protein n=1 Tax=Coprinopsis marcescibilis TaxID=230819 RepID=A0A5C3LCZ6_COPMA|nr:hypothetical protein FA15DRAFT_662264 [Coprinopsis marcescibilis]